MPSTIITIKYRQVSARDPIRTRYNDPERDVDVERAYRLIPARDPIRTKYNDPERDVDVERAYRHVPARDCARIVYESNDARRNEERIRSSYRRVTAEHPVRAGHDGHYAGRNEGTSRHAARREQSMPTRRASRCPGRSENTYRDIPSRQAQREQTDDDTTHSSHRTRRSETTSRAPHSRQAPSREPSNHTKRSSHRTQRSENTSHTSSSHQASDPPQREEEKRHQAKSSAFPQNPTPILAPPRVAGAFYATLAVSPNATQAEIVRAARRRRIQVHPDRLKTAGMAQREIDRINDEAQKVGLAADTLCDEVSRGEYDRAVRRGLRS